MNKEQLKKAVDWVVRSSADPTQLSLSLKAGLPFVVLVGSLAGLQLNEGELLTAVLKGAEVLTGSITLYGMLRKLYLTAVGKA